MLPFVKCKGKRDVKHWHSTWELSRYQRISLSIFQNTADFGTVNNCLYPDHFLTKKWTSHKPGKIMIIFKIATPLILHPSSMGIWGSVLPVIEECKPEYILLRMLEVSYQSPTKEHKYDISRGMQCPVYALHSTRSPTLHAWPCCELPLCPLFGLGNRQLHINE